MCSFLLYFFRSCQSKGVGKFDFIIFFSSLMHIIKVILRKSMFAQGRSWAYLSASSDLIQADRLERNPSDDGLRNPLTLAISESVSGCVIYTCCNNHEYSRLFDMVVSLTSYGFNKVPVSSAWLCPYSLWIWVSWSDKRLQRLWVLYESLIEDSNNNSDGFASDSRWASFGLAL